MKHLTRYRRQEDGVYYFSPPPSSDFEHAYLEVREREGRVYTDELVQQLPYIAKSHPQYREWQYRVWSTAHFFSHTTLEPHFQILDIGCGNGWFTHQLAQRSGAQVLGLDVNQAELRQAQRLFGSDHCHFAYGDIFALDWPSATFDQITLNACVQYFPNLRQLITHLQSLLRPDGAIQIIDSPFYTPQEVAAAKARTQAYYEQQDVPIMSTHYFHHQWDVLHAFGAKVRYNPKSLWAPWQRRLLGQGSPFSWITISQLSTT